MSAPLSPLIHLIDDDEAVRSSLALLISTVGLRVQGWGDPQQFLREFPRGGIGAIVLDVRMPGISGLAVLETLVREGVDQPVIMLTGHGTVDMCRRAFKAGAAEFLEKPVDDEALLEALQNAVRQHVKSRERLAADRAARERYAQLSEREKEVAGFIVEGLTNKEIGRALALSPRTVETHRANLFAKLQADSLAQLIRRYATLIDDAGAPSFYAGAGVAVRIPPERALSYSSPTVTTDRNNPRRTPCASSLPPSSPPSPSPPPAPTPRPCAASATSPWAWPARSPARP